MARTLDAELRGTTATRRKARRVRGSRIALYAVLTLIALFFVIPLLWMLSTSLKAESALFRDRSFFPSQPTLENFQRILTASGQTPVLRYMFNSIGVATIGTILTVLLTSLSGYAFARIDFRGKSIVFAALITTLLLPGIMFLVPQ
jgi:multiple sugar transport system permease protein